MRRLLGGFARNLSGGFDPVIAIDGKALRRSFDKASGKSPLYLVQAFAAEARLVLGQVAVDEKSNEITAIPELLALLDVKGRIITLGEIGPVTVLFRPFESIFCHKGDKTWQHDHPKNSNETQCALH